jgi:predicted transcriptional regulator
MNSTTLGITLENRLKERLERLGRVLDRSPDALVQTAIVEYLDREEAREREALEDAERWDEYQLTGHSISNDSMMEWLDELERRL